MCGSRRRRRRLEAGHGEALRHVDETTYRVWRLYLSGSAHGFTTGRLNVFQALLSLPDAGGASGIPLTRGDWYGPEAQKKIGGVGPAVNRGRAGGAAMPRGGVWQT